MLRDDAGPPEGGGGGAGGVPAGAAPPVFEPGCASLYSHVPYDQAPSVLNVGERTNANGSRRFRDAMLAQDWETCTELAKEAVRAGSHVLDVCVDYTGADGVADMAEVASRFATQSTLPLMVDSTEAPVIERALQHIAGKPIINSVNLEEGDGAGTRLDGFLSLAREYGAAVVCTCIDADGQARTADWKLRAARSIYDLAVERYGLAPEDLFFDALALPVSTGMEESRRDGIETIEGIKLIKAALPGARTLLGVSNVSFGLSAPPARPSTRCSCTSASRPASMPPLSTPAGSCPSTACPPKRSRYAWTSFTTGVTRPATTTP